VQRTSGTYIAVVGQPLLGRELSGKETTMANFTRIITVAVLAVGVATGAFFYAGYGSAAKPVPSKNALHEVPAVTGIDTSAALMW
jgi:hypothetical protein